MLNRQLHCRLDSLSGANTIEQAARLGCLLFRCDVIKIAENVRIICLGKDPPVVTVKADPHLIIPVEVSEDLVSSYQTQTSLDIFLPIFFSSLLHNRLEDGSQ